MVNGGQHHLFIFVVVDGDFFFFLTVPVSRVVVSLQRVPKGSVFFGRDLNWKLAFARNNKTVQLSRGARAAGYL